MSNSNIKKVILGIDPGLAITGYGLISINKRNIKLLDYGVITSGAKDAFGSRLHHLYQELTKIIKKYRPDEVAIEELFFAKNAKTALKVGQARGVAYLAAWQSKSIVREFTPLQVKQAITGYGFAPKQQIQRMIKLLLALKTVPKPDDVADALAIALCSAQTKIF